MKCIKGKCPYYQWHLYNDSCFVCGLVNATFEKNSDVNCTIDGYMVKQSLLLEELEFEREEIRDIGCRLYEDKEV